MSFQNQIVKYTFLLITLITVLSCNVSDDDAVEPERDLFFFLEKTNPQFSGDLNDTFTLWQTFPLGDFSSNGAIFFENNNGNGPIRKLRYFMINGANRITISTPYYDSTSETAVDNLYGLGIKNLGAEDVHYNIKVQKGDEIYDICDQNANYQLEVIKTEVIPTEVGQEPQIKVWFTIDDINFSDCNPEIAGTLNNGLFLATFFGYSSQ